MVKRVALAITIHKLHWHNKECERIRRRKNKARRHSNGAQRNAKRYRDGACIFCGTSENLTLDHVLPLKFGGKNCPGNYQTVCGWCHERKTVTENKIISALENGFARVEPLVRRGGRNER